MTSGVDNVVFDNLTKFIFIGGIFLVSSVNYEESFSLTSQMKNKERNSLDK